jgi:Protein of unknown function (DUF3040)
MIQFSDQVPDRDLDVSFSRVSPEPMPAYAGQVDTGHRRVATLQGGAVPLSEHEQRLLEQMERALYAEDPKFASALRGHDLRGRYRRRALLGVIGVLTGLALLPVGIAGKAVLVSVIGFLVMLGSAIFAVSSWRRAPGEGDTTASVPTVVGRGRLKGGRKSKQKRPGLMERLEERWRHRREGDGR